MTKISNEVNLLNIKLRNVKNEMSDYKDVLNNIKANWTDKKKEEFFVKYINKTVEDADDYLLNCEKLITYIEDVKKITEI